MPHQEHAPRDELVTFSDDTATSEQEVSVTNDESISTDEFEAIVAIFRTLKKWDEESKINSKAA